MGAFGTLGNTVDSSAFSPKNTVYLFRKIKLALVLPAGGSCRRQESPWLRTGPATNGAGSGRFYFDNDMTANFRELHSEALDRLEQYPVNLL